MSSLRRLLIPALVALTTAVPAVCARAAVRPGPPKRPPPTKPRQLPRPPKLYQNPVFAPDFPDPMVLKVGRVYYAYATATSWEPPGHRFPILRSRDLVHWRPVGDAFTSEPSWSSGNWWAPSVLERRGRFFLYYTGFSRARQSLCVAVATSTSPAGPFTPRAMIACGLSPSSGYIDPAPLLDSRGRGWLYFARKGVRHAISVVPLARSLTRPDGRVRGLFGISQPWEVGAGYATVEAPFPARVGTGVGLFYSANDWTGGYQMGYALAPEPRGPFVKSRRNPVLGKGPLGDAGGGSVVEGPHGGLWMVYASWSTPTSPAAPRVRNLRLDRVEWGPDGPRVVGPTTTPQRAP